MAEQKLALVTGVAGDIGRAIAGKMLRNGISVIGGDISAEGLNETHEELLSLCHAEASYTPQILDIREASSVTQLMDRAAKSGGVDILVNNAGGITAPTIMSATEADWVQDMNINLIGAWRCLKEAAFQMAQKQAGAILNIASVNGLGVFGHPGYSAAKAGLIHLTKSAAVELGPHGIRVNAVCPGTVKTQAWRERQEENPSIMEEAKKWYPMRDVCTPEDVAELVFFCAVSAPRVLSGAIIPLDGGLTAGQDALASAFTGLDFLETSSSLVR